MNALIVGRGRIGQALSVLLPEHEISRWQVEFFPGYAPDRKLYEMLDRADALFVAISTRDNGEAAFNYIWQGMKAGLPVVTCEKGALAFRFLELKDHLPRLGYTATMGSGSRLLHTLKRAAKPINKIEGIISGSINYIFWSSHHGCNLDATIETARKLELLEPGPDDLERIFRAELDDTVRKACIMYNLCGFGGSINPRKFFINYPNEQTLRSWLKPGTNLRFLVSIEDLGERVHPKDLFRAIVGHKIVRGYLTNTERVESLFANPVNAENNVIRVESQEYHVISHIGPGAGSVCTAEAMIRDIEDQLIGS